MTARVRAQLVQSARDFGVSVAAVKTARVQELFSALPVRYRRLAERVWLRLPEDWDSHAHWEIVVGDIPSDVDTYLAGAQRLPHEGSPYDLQRWTIRLVPSVLDRLTDDEVMRVLAHEFAHVASGLDMRVMLRDQVTRGGSGRCDPALVGFWDGDLLSKAEARRNFATVFKPVTCLLERLPDEQAHEFRDAQLVLVRQPDDLVVLVGRQPRRHMDARLRFCHARPAAFLRAIGWLVHRELPELLPNPHAHELRDAHVVLVGDLDDLVVVG